MQEGSMLKKEFAISVYKFLVLEELFVNRLLLLDLMTQGPFRMFEGLGDMMHEGNY